MMDRGSLRSRRKAQGRSQRAPAEDAPVSDAEAARLFADLARAPALVLAVSGGPDSTALLSLAARWRARRRRGPKLLAVTVDHGLRPESGREAAAVKRLAHRLGLAHRTVRWREKPATGLQEKARAARYHLLAEQARRLGARHILTAHTLDDQAETVLFRMARGSGLSGLAAMARVAPVPRLEAPAMAAPSGGDEADETLVRPLLGLPKSRLIATLRAHRIAFSDDPSNRDPRFARVRLRALMPALAEEGLDARRLALLARRLRRADTAIEAMVEAARQACARTEPGGPITLDLAFFESMPDEIALRLVGRAIAQVGEEGPVELGKLESLMAALAASREARFRRTLAGAMVTRARDEIVIERAPPRRRRSETPDWAPARRRKKRNSGKIMFTKRR